MRVMHLQHCMQADFEVFLPPIQKIVKIVIYLISGEHIAAEADANRLSCNHKHLEQATIMSDFRQEYDDNKAVKEFCEVNFGITFPIAEVTHVIGKKAHPFYRWLVTEYNLKPRWNFTKILIDRQGEVIASFGSTVRPNSQRMQDAIVEVLKK